MADAGKKWEVTPEQKLVLFNVPWPSYVAIGDALPDRPALRMTYCRGTLEFLTTSCEHEIIKARFRRLFETLTEECNVPIAGFGSMTFQRPDLELCGAGRMLLDRKPATDASVSAMESSGRSAARSRSGSGDLSKQVGPHGNLGSWAFPRCGAAMVRASE